MWTQAHRATYKQSGTALPSDLRDAQWERLEPLIPAAKPGGRPRKTDMRAAMNAIFYLLRTGCPWRYLPRGPFPPRSTVYNIFRQFRRDGVWERIWEGRTSYGAARGARPRGQPHRRDPRQPVAESGDGSSSTRSASAFHGWNLFGPTQATTPIRSRVPWPDRRGSGSKSSSAPTTSKASSSCPGDGSSSEPSHGSAATAVSPKTTRTSQKLSPPS